MEVVMSRDQLQQKELEGAQRMEAQDVDVDAEHKPDVSRRASNASLGRAAVQMKGNANEASVHEAAERGKSSPASEMPHMEKIQRAFGQHDVSDIQAHTGESSANEMGAEAYATGNHVMFGSTAPDLHTAAHEAAHVVQQSRGVNLAGGVGQVGDAHERNADAVADRVVAGESAVDLLGGESGGAVKAEGHEVQRKPHKEEEKEATPEQKKEGHELSDIRSRAAVSSSLKLFAKNMHTAAAQLDQQVKGPHNTEAWTAPAIQAIDEIYQRIWSESMHVGGLMTTYHFDASLARYMAPEIKLALGAYHTFAAAMGRANDFTRDQDKSFRNPDFVWQSVSQFASKAGYAPADLAADKTVPEGTEVQVRSGALTDHLHAALAAAKSAGSGTASDAERLTKHVDEVALLTKSHAGEIKAHKKEIEELKAAIKDLGSDVSAPLLAKLTVSAMSRTLPRPSR